MTCRVAGGRWELTVCRVVHTVCVNWPAGSCLVCHDIRSRVYVGVSERRVEWIASLMDSDSDASAAAAAAAGVDLNVIKVRARNLVSLSV